MLNIINIVAPIFLLIGAGFLASRFRILDRQQIAGLGQFVVLFALPALILKALLERPLTEFIEPNYLLAYGLGSFLTFWGCYAFARTQQDTLAGCAISGLGSCASNSGFIAYPIIVMIVGPTAVLGLALCMLIENLLIIPMGLAAAEWGSQRGTGISLWRSLSQMFLNLLKKPLILAMIFGVLMSTLNLRLPSFVIQAVNMLALASAPVAIFVIGASLQGFQMKSQTTDILRVALAKLVVHPLMVLLLFCLFPVSPDLRIAGVLFAAAPMMSIYAIIGQPHGLAERCAATLVVTTLAASLTLGIFIWLLT